jgi:hypothetical protein
MLILDLFEARDKKKTYDLLEIKGQVERVTVRLEGSESAAFTKMAREYKKIDVELKKLQTQRDKLNAKAKEAIQNYFDAEDIIYTRVIETVSMSLSMSKHGKAGTKTDNDKVVEELIKIMPELAGKIAELQKKFESEVKGRAPSLTVTTNIDEGVKDIVKRIAAFIKGLTDWGTRYDAKLAKIKMMMKPMRQVRESYYADKAPDEIKVKKFVKKLKDEAKKEEPKITQEDVDKVVEELEETDGDQMLKRKDIKRLCKNAEVDSATVLQVIGFDEEPAEEPVAENVVVRDKSTPINRTAEYIKKASGLKVGTGCIKTHYPNSRLYIGDWVRVGRGENPNTRHADDEYGYIVSKADRKGPSWEENLIKVDVSTGAEPEIIEVPVSLLKWRKRWKDNENFIDAGGKEAEKITAKKEKDTAKKSNTEFTLTDGTACSVYGRAATQPNMNFPTAGQALHVDDTKPRTAAEKKAAKEFIAGVEANFKIHKKFVEENPSPNTKDREQVLKNAERVINTYKNVNGLLDEYVGFIKVLNTTANNGDRELFDEAREELTKLTWKLRDDFRTIKLRASLPSYATRARVLAAVAIEHIHIERDKVDTWAKRRDWSAAKKAAARKASDRMKLAWKE